MQLIISPGQALDGVLWYVGDEHSFMFDEGEPQELDDRAGSLGTTSLAVGTLQIEVGIETGTLLFVWGYYPRMRWRSASLPIPSARPGIVNVAGPHDLMLGVGEVIAPAGAWSTWFDERTGWVCIAPRFEDAASADQVIVATSTVLGVVRGELQSVWLQPVFD